MRLRNLAVAFLLSAPTIAPISTTRALAQTAAEENPIALASIKHFVESFAVSPDGKSVVVWGVDWGDGARDERAGQLQVWDIATRTQKASMVGHKDMVQKAIWSRDGSQVASQSQDGMVALWDAATGKLKHSLVPSNTAAFDGDTPEGQLLQHMAMAERPRLLGFSPDGSQVLATAGKLDLPKAPPKDKDGKPVRVQIFDHIKTRLLAWDSATGRLLRSVECGNLGAWGSSSVLLPDGKSILTTVNARLKKEISASGVEIHDAQSGALIRSWELPKPLTYISRFSSDGSLVLGVDIENRKRVQLFEASTGKPLQVLEDAQANLASASFSRDNAKLLAQVPGGALAVFDIARGKREALLSTDFSNDLSAADTALDGKYLLASQQAGRDLLRFDLGAPPSNPVVSRALAEVSNVRAIRFAPDGSLWVGWGDSDWGQETRKGKSLQLRHIAPDGQELGKAEVAEELLIDQVTFSPDFSLAAAQLGKEPKPAYLEGAGVGVWDVASKKRLWHLPGNQYLMDSLAFAPGNKTLLTASNEGKVQEWDLESGKLAREILHSASGIESLQIAPDGKSVAISIGGGAEGRVVLVAMPSGQKVAELQTAYSARGLAWSPDGKYLATGGTVEVAGTVVGISASVWDVPTRQPIAEFAVPERLFSGLALSPDGQRLAVSHFQGYERRDDGQVSVWDIASQRALATLRDRSGAENPAFSPDGKSLATTNGRWLKAWPLPADTAALRP